MKIVAVSQRIDTCPENNEVRDALDQRLLDFLLTAGYLPVPVPNRLQAREPDDQTLTQWLAHIRPQAIVLSGGNDVGSVQLRDLTESKLLEYARHEGQPVLGICRGMQMMAVHAGGKLYRVDGHVRSRHQLIGETARNVNSYHRLALSAPPAGFEVVARSSDGAIEAIRHTFLPWEGWMWHPEREAVFDTEDLSRIRSLFGAP